jgi:hypothetical protein
MTNHKHFTPRRYLGVMVSSTFTDLEKHRDVLIKAIKGRGLTDIAMENDSAKPDLDVIDSSLQMVSDASAYIAIISHKYGQTPISPERNPNQLSITELEFNEALRLGRPILLFIMGDDHPVRKADVETDPLRREKLNAFRERAKQMQPGSQVHRVYATFDSLEEFSSKAIHAVAEIRRYLDEQNDLAIQQPADKIIAAEKELNLIPTPPTFYAEPPYIGSHKFVGRKAQLDVLNDWASAADPHPVLLFDAIGGSGKSMLTWEWITHYASQVRGDWAGRFWYSFYERGAIMTDFCSHALAYFLSKPLDQFKKMKTVELRELLIHHLQTSPWLIVLDGIERVLVAYHRIDAAQLPDEVANSPSDQIAHRDPCSAIRPEDDDFLRALSAIAPSKVLITTRLVPRVLLNSANQPIPGVRRESLPGLRPADAELLLHSCGITGDSQAIQDYLKSHCDCHPLVTGILAGLINDYLPNKGNFDAWVASPIGGAQLNLANLDLIQKRNHILRTALESLPEESHQLLSTLALLAESVDYPALSALNPHLPPEPEKVEEPEVPENQPWWEGSSDDEKKQMQQEYRIALEQKKAYEYTHNAWRQSLRNASQALANTVRDLERRGLLQYDGQTKRYDLHPVVRGIAAGSLQPEETNRYGQRVVDHFSQQSHNPYENADTIEDLMTGLHVVRTLVRMGKLSQACDLYLSELSKPLHYNLESYSEILSLLHPFFPNGYSDLSACADDLSLAQVRSLASDIASALYYMNIVDEALQVDASVLLSRVNDGLWDYACDSLMSIAVSLGRQNRLAKDDFVRKLALDLAGLIGDEQRLLVARLRRYRQLASIGSWEDADRIWKLIDIKNLKRTNKRGLQYFLEKRWTDSLLESLAYYSYAEVSFWRGEMKEEYLILAEELAKSEKDRESRRLIHALRGEWYIEQKQWNLAEDSLNEAVRMARIVGVDDFTSETGLAISKLHLDQLSDPRQIAEKLGQSKERDLNGLGELWLTIGDHQQAKKYALLAFHESWADGEPFVRRHELKKAMDLLERLDVEIPSLLPYNLAKAEKLPWEDEVVTAIEKLRLEKSTKETPKTAE